MIHDMHNIFNFDDNKSFQSYVTLLFEGTDTE